MWANVNHPCHHSVIAVSQLLPPALKSHQTTLQITEYPVFPVYLQWKIIHAQCNLIFWYFTLSVLLQRATNTVKSYLILATPQLLLTSSPYENNRIQVQKASLRATVFFLTSTSLVLCTSSTTKPITGIGGSCDWGAGRSWVQSSVAIWQFGPFRIAIISGVQQNWAHPQPPLRISLGKGRQTFINTFISQLHSSQIFL